MWAPNGPACCAVAALLAVILSMEASSITCYLVGAACYAVAALLPPRGPLAS